MLSFSCDYNEGAHAKVLEKLMETNLIQVPGYGEDKFCESAKKKIRAACECPNADVFFLVGGTQTNMVVIDSMLAKYEGVVSAVTGHINGHEAGAIEFSGHKVLAIPQHEGKIRAAELEDYLDAFWADETHSHMVHPGMVYISHPTEYGTLYTRDELASISAVCRRFKIPLYRDGARMGYGLMSYRTDVTLPVIAEYCDVFYIGGTKVGALCGEAVVFTKKNAPKCFMTMVKQHGAMLAKGRLLGVQFDALFTDDLYFKISRHAIDMAEKLRKGLEEKGYSFFIDSPTNQQFIVLENEQVEALRSRVMFSVWEKPDDEHTVVRFATSWATTEENVDKLLDMMEDKAI